LNDEILQPSNQQVLILTSFCFSDDDESNDGFTQSQSTPIIPLATGVIDEDSLQAKIDEAEKSWLVKNQNHIS